MGMNSYTEPCTVEGCETIKNSRLYCNMHWKRWKKHGDPLVAPQPAAANLPPVRTGENAWHFKGIDIGYRGAHKRAASQRGAATNHSCVDCGEGAEEWSYDSGDPQEQVETIPNDRGYLSDLSYSPDPDYYSPRCRPCHRVHDRRPVVV